MADSQFTRNKLLAMTLEMRDEIADFQHEMRLGSENEAIRQLIQIGLDTPRQPPRRERGRAKE